jgi:hypothetical protein
MKEYAVKTKFIFEGTFFVKADSYDEARKTVEEDCGLVLGGNIHTTQNKDAVNWDFDVHPEKVIDWTVKVEERRS